MISIALGVLWSQGAAAIETASPPRKERLMLVEDSWGAWHLAMPTEYAAVLRDSMPGFQLWDDTAYPNDIRLTFNYDHYSAPFAIIRDLNRDGRLDLVLDGWTNQGTRSVVMIVSRHKGFRVVRAAGSGSLRQPKRAGAGLQVHQKPDSTYGFSWGSRKDDVSYFFSWSDSLGLTSLEL